MNPNADDFIKVLEYLKTYPGTWLIAAAFTFWLVTNQIAKMIASAKGKGKSE